MKNINNQLRPATLSKRLLLIFLAATVFSIGKIKAADYYWVGGTGNWSDFANHWATSSGGTTFYTSLPTPNDNVYFDANSFSTTGQVVTSNVVIAFCNNMDWINALFNPSFSLQNQLRVYGSLLLSSGMVFSGGNILLEATSPGQSIVTADTPIDCNFLFEGLNGSWTLFGDLIVPNFGTINFTNDVSFYSNNNTINCENFNFNSSDTLDLGTSNVISQLFTVGPTGTIIANSSHIQAYTFNSSDHTFNNADGGAMNCTNCILNDVSFQEINGTGSIFHNAEFFGSYQTSTGYNTFNKITFNNADVTIGGATYDTLFLNNPGHTVRANGTLNINSLFATNAQASNGIAIESYYPGTPAYISKSGSIVCLDNLYLTDMYAIGGATFYAGANSINLGNDSGWVFSSCSAAQSSNVWPGDANYDLTANNLDVLNIGLAYGETGPVRTGASNSWIAQPATDWSSFFLSAVNKKHADCDGNGVVDNNDTLAISLNYGLTHPARLANVNSNQSSSPQLYLVANPDTVIEGDTIEVDIFLGTQTFPVDSIYGIAFTMNFDTSLVDTSYMPFDYTGSWMGTPGVDLLTFEKKLFLQGQVDVALTRTDHLNQSGYGFIGRAGIVIVDNVGARMTNSPPYVTLPLSVSNVRALTASEYYLTISTNGDNVEIDTLGTTGIHYADNLNEMISVYPNPVKDVLTINSGKAKINSLEIYNSLGQVILNEKTATSKINLDTQNFEQGIYLLKLETDAGIVNRKFSVVRN
ncbi:MAG: T9SS type A sorting domain-containing protein [Bacteroidia bacterium]